MVEINFEDSISQHFIENKTEEELEEAISSKIVNGLMDEMKDHINEMSFIDMQMDHEQSRFDIKAELVLCSKSDIITNAEIQAQKMSALGLTEEQILDILETQLTDNKGF
jgi:hypothetical protein